MSNWDLIFHQIFDDLPIPFRWDYLVTSCAASVVAVDVLNDAHGYYDTWDCQPKMHKELHHKYAIIIINFSITHRILNSNALHVHRKIEIALYSTHYTVLF